MLGLPKSNQVEAPIANPRKRLKKMNQRPIALSINMTSLGPGLSHLLWFWMIVLSVDGRFETNRK